MPGSAQSLPGQDAGVAAGFACGQPLDVAPGCATLGLFLEDAAGDQDRYAGVSDEELLGVICGWDRVEPTPAPTPWYLTHQRTGPLSRRVGN